MAKKADEINIVQSLMLNPDDVFQSKMTFKHRAKSTTTLNPYLASMYTDKALFGAVN
jgi:hypothetical protein